MIFFKKRKKDTDIKAQINLGEFQILRDNLTVEEYFELRESVGWAAYDYARAEKALNLSLSTYLIKDNQKNIAMGRTLGDGIYISIVDLVVRPEYQRLGVGRLLIDTMVSDIRSALNPGDFSCFYVTSEVGAEGFYRRLGFVDMPGGSFGGALRKAVKGENKEPADN